jgi:hypothetical protein
MAGLANFTVLKLLVAVGKSCLEYQDAVLRKRITHAFSEKAENLAY